MYQVVAFLYFWKSAQYQKDWILITIVPNWMFFWWISNYLDDNNLRTLWKLEN